MKRREQGFTLVEVMIALTVFMVALSGLVMLQRASLDGSQRARKSTAGIDIARFFLTQVQSEISAWKRDLPSTSFAGMFPLISPLVAGDDPAVNPWKALDAASQLRVDEYLGHSALSAADDPVAAFCVNYKVIPLGGAATFDAAVVWKVRVRVSWTKPKQYSDNWKSCLPADVATRIGCGGSGMMCSDDVVELVGVATRELAQ